MKMMPFQSAVAIFLLLNLTTLSQENIPVLQPELNKQYIYEITQSQYIPGENGERYTDIVRRKMIEIQFITLQPENRNLLLVTVLENVAIKPDAAPVLYNDYRFPLFKDGFYNYRAENFNEQLFSTVKFHYELNKEKREVKLHNRGDVLLQIKEVLIQKGLDEKEIDRYTSEFNTDGIPLITNYLQKIFFISEEIIKEEENDISVFKSKTVNNDSLVNVIYDKEDTIPGLVHWEYNYNPQKQFLIGYNAIRVDTLKWPRLVFNKMQKRYTYEENILLVLRKDIQEEKLLISGVIENARNKKVTVGILRDPFGASLHLESTFLDENNSFIIETDFPHSGLVHLQFGQASDERNLPMLAFYAEPGSKIYIKADVSSFPQNVEFNGDYSHEANLIHTFRTKYGWVGGSFNINPIYALMNVSFYTSFYDAVSNFDSFINNNKAQFNNHAFNFITAELKAQLLVMGFYYLKIKESWMSRTFNSPDDLNLEKIDVTFIENQVKEYDIIDSYNDYGFYSRLLAGELLNYHFTKSRKVAIFRNDPYFTPVFVSSDYQFVNDLPHQVEVAKMILAGHALYSHLAELLQQVKMGVSYDLTKDERYLQNEIEKYLDLMLRLVNDPEFGNAVELMMNNYRRWKDTDFVPELEFLKQNGEQVQLKDFFGRKPSIFYVSQNWGAERYYWDDLSKENPEMNLVTIMEGSNFSEWTDYLARAEPAAHQLFWKNNEFQLKDIFKRDYRHFVVYNKDGIRIGFAENPVEAVNLVKHDLMMQKKEPDKSLLIVFVIVLASLLISTLLVLVIWKWRVRQRFRKEQQQRRLRELELTAIRSQMNPHFLFNCLNSVQNLVQQNKGREAHLYLADFAGLIRKVLNNSEKEEVSLAEELDMVKQYLSLEKLRFDFDFRVDISDEVDVYNTSVPSMLLQPFVENAVTHGLQNIQGERKLRIEVLKYNENGNVKDAGKGIIISIEDNGIGRLAAQNIDVTKNGKGTRLMQERLAILQQQQKEKYWLQTSDLNNNGTSGTKVEIFVPEEN